MRLHRVPWPVSALKMYMGEFVTVCNYPSYYKKQTGCSWCRYKRLVPGGIRNVCQENPNFCKNFQVSEPSFT